MKFQWNDLKRINLYSKLKSRADNYYIDIDKQKLTKNKKLNWNIPWDHINLDHTRSKLCEPCGIIVESLGFIPKFCLGCWKVCVTPRTLRELFQLRDLMQEMVGTDPGCWCKCGVELRQWTPGKLYGGYFYTNSKDAGLERWRQVRKLINPDIPVILKRYCTEFEIRFGDSSEYQRPVDADAQEDMFFHIMDTELPELQQPKWAKLQVQEVWIQYGWRYGTPEDRKQIEQDHNSGEPLYYPPRTYHPED